MESKSTRCRVRLLHVTYRKVSASIAVLSVFYMAVYRNGYNGADLKSDVLWKTWRVGSNPTTVVQID